MSRGEFLILITIFILTGVHYWLGLPTLERRIIDAIEAHSCTQEPTP